LEKNESTKQFYHSKAIAILMKSPQEGGCHACGGLAAQTLLYSLSCLGLIPISVCRWGELAGTETAGYLEDCYQLSYSEGRAEQFLSCCVAASGGLTEAEKEIRICKWTRYKRQQQRDVDSSHDYNNPSKVAFRDATFRNAIFLGQKLYQPVNGKLLVVSKSQKRLMEPPANAWPNPSSRQKSTQTVFWDQHTQSTKKRVLGRNRLAKAKKKR
jgi:hypothetical protein